MLITLNWFPGAEDNVVPTKRSRVEPISDCNIKLSSSSMGTVEETIEKGGMNQ